MLHLSSFVLALQPAPIHHTVRTVARSPPVCMRKKPFKGGDLGEFLKAGEAEAKFGPGRYAAVQEDLWRTKMKNERQEVRRELSMEAYKLQKAQILQDHAFLSALGLAAFWSFVDPQVTTRRRAAVCTRPCARRAGPTRLRLDLFLRRC